MKKRHHFRPVLHLKHFAGQDGLVWVFDKSGNAAPFVQRPENVGYEKGLYSIEGSPNTATDAFEDWLAEQIDRPAAGPLRKAARGEVLSQLERSQLAAFIAVQDLRTPLTRGLVLEKLTEDRGDLRKRFGADPKGVAEDLARDLGTRFTVDEIVQYLKRYEAMPENDFWLGLIHSIAGKVAKLVNGMSWNHGVAPVSTPFITTDIGIAKGVDDAKNLVPWAPGIEGRRNHWIIPLTPGSALILEPAGDAMTGTLKESFVEAVNERLRLDAVRWVYSRDRPAAC